MNDPSLDPALDPASSQPSDASLASLDLSSNLTTSSPDGNLASSGLQPSLRWHESWIIRAAALAAFILFLGYASSAYFAFQSIEGVAKLAHDSEIEQSLGKHLEALKDNYQLTQRLILERLQAIAMPYAKIGDSGPSAEVVQRWAREQAGQLLPGADLSAIKVLQTGRAISRQDIAPPVRWLDRDELALLNWRITFPRGDIYEAFKAAEDVRQRYQIIGAKLDSDIRPTLLRATAVILVLSFLVLVSLLIIYAQRFKRKTFEVIAGFSRWSEADSSFRFVPRSYKGELKLITSQFNAMADEVEANRQRNLYLEKIASWQIIARKLAHEIKNPLTPIQMMVSQLKRRYKGDDDEFQKLLDNAQTIITEEVAGLRRMVDNFSQFARLPQPEFKATDLVAICRHAAELEQARFDQHKITFKSSLPQAIADIDEDLIRQVLLNLVKNAGEASTDRQAKIEILLDATASTYILTVRDDGPGIPEDLQSRIFEAYFTTKHTGPSPGMGLGLAVCQKIVMDHGGKMHVTSRPGETLFSIKIPKQKPSVRTIEKE